MKFRSIAAAAALCWCAPPMLAQSLTRVQILGLQQQLRDDGCGVSHVTGRMDAMTRRAVKNCMSKYNVSSGGAPALLAAMNIGLGSSDALPTLASARQGNLQGGVGGQVQLPSDSTGMRDTTGRGLGHRRRMHRRGRGNMGGNMPSDSTRRNMRRRMRGDTMPGRMRDTARGNMPGNMPNDSTRGGMRDSMRRDTGMRRDSTTTPPSSSPMGNPPGTRTP